MEENAPAVVFDRQAIAGGVERLPLWGELNAPWYRATYAEAIAAAGIDGDDDAALADFWRRQGYAQGHRPTWLFDEAGYLARYPDVVMGTSLGIFASGFMHYCESGFLARDPHWLFSEEDYFFQNRDLTLALVRAQGWTNGYDHFLRVGEREGRSGSRFFDPNLFQAQCEERRIQRDGRFGGFLTLLEAPEAREIRASWYFDPQWYAEAYPEAVQAVADGAYRSLLHHYLTNPSQRSYDPNAFFSEAFYLDAAPDIVGAIEEGVFRNGYDHFLRHGLKEGRMPHPAHDLAPFAAREDVQTAVRQGRYADVFVCYVARRDAAASETPAPPPMTLAQRAWLELERARTMLPSLARTPLDFSLKSAPTLTIIVLGHGDLFRTLTSLASIGSALDGRIDLVVVEPVPRDRALDLADFIDGASVLRVRRAAPVGEALSIALGVAKAAHSLVLRSGERLEAQALRAAYDAVMARPSGRGHGCGFVTGQVLDAEGTVHEAGIRLHRDGVPRVLGRGMRAFADECGIRRACDFGYAGPVVAETDALRTACGRALREPLGVILAAAALTVAGDGKEVWYEPYFVSHLPAMPQPAGDETQAIAAFVRTGFHAALRWMPQPPPGTVSGDDWGGVGARVLFVTETPVDRRLGGLEVRRCDLLAAMIAHGARITVLALAPARTQDAFWQAGLSDRIEQVVAASYGEIAGFLLEKGAIFDVVWLSGTAAAGRIVPLLEQNPVTRGGEGYVLDAGWLLAEETNRRRHVGLVNDPELYRRELEKELAPGWFCQTILALHKTDAALIAAAGYADVKVLGHAVSPCPGVPSFDERQGLVHALPIRRSGDATHDGLAGMANHVMPVLNRRLPPEAMLSVIGHIAPDVDLFSLTQHPRMAPFIAEAAPEQRYARGRIMIAPSRVAAGLPYEIMRAAAYGMPAVIGPDLAASLGWENERECLVSRFEDTASFADAISRLYTDRPLWERLSAAARDAVTRDGDPWRFDRIVSTILKDARSLTD